MTAEEVSAFGAWQAEAEDNRAAWRAIDSAHHAAGSVANFPEMAVLLEEARGRRGARGFAPWQVAASVALLLTGASAIGLYGLASRQSAAPASALVQTYRTGIGERKTITLADGSVVTLDTSSTLNVLHWATERRVSLVGGEAFFRVAKDAARPFIVQTASGNVRALGTAFSVRTIDRGFRVALTEGKVRVAIPAEESQEMLTPGQMLTYDGAVIRRNLDGAEKATRWLSGELVFQNVAIADAIAEMNRYSTRKLLWAGDTTAGQRKLSGVFKTGDVHTFVRALSAYGMARIQTENAAEVKLVGA
ncbi:hypothetical protein ASE22_02890 [Sphingomonas sp. Root720]|nr:hypothetical protein ASE22_02890 [Sphingomonas sp. Root720]